MTDNKCNKHAKHTQNIRNTHAKHTQTAHVHTLETLRNYLGKKVWVEMTYPDKSTGHRIETLEGIMIDSLSEQTGTKIYPILKTVEDLTEGEVEKILRREGYQLNVNLNEGSISYHYLRA
jgi:hypothetical protein